MNIIQEILHQVRLITAEPLTNAEHAELITTFYTTIVTKGRTFTEAQLQSALTWICNFEAS